MAVGISAAFKKDDREYNGLTVLEKQLVEDVLAGHPGRHVIVAVVEAHKLGMDVADQTWTPTVRLVNVEVLEGKEAATARDMLDQAFRKRTGRQEDPQRTLFETDTVEGQDPTAGPWPGDADFPAAEPADEAAEPATDESDGPPVKRGRKAS